MMKTSKFSLSHLRIIGLLCVAGLLLAGFTEVQARYSISQIQQAPVNVPVPVLRQATGTSCGEAVIAMTYNYAFPNTPISEQEVIDYATANGYYTEGLT